MKLFVVPSLLLVFCLSIVSGKVYFEDRFLEGNINRWTISEAESEKLGKCEFAKHEPAVDDKEDGGLNTTQEARFYRYSAPFKSELINKDKNMCVQFSVKYPDGADCAGGYVKLMNKAFKQSNFHGDTPYEIMFGPDFCGYATRMVHVIFSHEGKNHLVKDTINIDLNNNTRLYTLHVFPNNTFEVLVDRKFLRNGSLVDDFEMLKPRMIDDPESKKPEDWVDDPDMDDPEDKKPDDWDQPETIVDENATKPEDWNDDTDGEWSAPMIPNPGYKGTWRPKRIPNPKYKGEWKAKQIANPDFVDNPHLYSRAFSYIGLDLWQVKSGTIFDNFIVSDDLKECEEHAKYWKKRFDFESKLDEERRGKLDEDIKVSRKEPDLSAPETPDMEEEEAEPKEKGKEKPHEEL